MSANAKVIQGMGQTATTATVMVRSAEVCENLSDDIPVGSMAMTADGSFFAMKDLDGNWVPWIAEEEPEEDENNG